MTTERKRAEVRRLTQQYHRATRRAERLRRVLTALASRPDRSAPAEKET